MDFFFNGLLVHPITRVLVDDAELNLHRAYRSDTTLFSGSPSSVSQFARRRTNSDLVQHKITATPLLITQASS
jgi:hypothetical protein